MSFLTIEQEVRDKYWHVKPDDVVIDVGCQWGLYTIPSVGAGATVYAIDPEKNFTNEIPKYCNGQTSKLTIINKAIGEECGYPTDMLQAMETTKNFGGAIGVCWLLNESTPFTTLDKVVEEYSINRLDWLKIDVEGGELSVLKGGTNTLTKFHPTILIEDHSLIYAFVKERNFTAQIKQLLLSLNYSVEDYYYDKDDPPRDYLIAR